MNKLKGIKKLNTPIFFVSLINNVLCLIFFCSFKSPCVIDGPKVEYFFNSTQEETEKITLHYENLTFPVIKSLFSSDLCAG
jgi:hypothetical protein